MARLSLRQLRYLDSLASERHFGRAAERVSVSQPALSAQIRDLEEKLGVQLVERTSAGVHLTPVGRGVVERAARILAAVGDLEDFAQSQSGRLRGPLRLGIIPSIAPYLLPRLLPLLRRHHPDLALNIRETVTATLVQELAHGDLDVVVASLPLGQPVFEERAAFEDTFLLALPPTGPYAHLKPEQPADLPLEALLLLEDGHCLRDQAIAACGGLEARALRASGVTSLATILQLVAAGQGVTLLPQLFVDAEPLDPGRVQLVRLSDPEPRRTIGAAWRRTSPRGADFADFAALVAQCRPAGRA